MTPHQYNQLLIRVARATHPVALEVYSYLGSRERLQLALQLPDQALADDDLRTAWGAAKREAAAGVADEGTMTGADVVRTLHTAVCGDTEALRRLATVEPSLMEDYFTRRSGGEDPYQALWRVSRAYPYTYVAARARERVEQELAGKQVWPGSQALQRVFRRPSKAGAAAQAELAAMHGIPPYEVALRGRGPGGGGGSSGPRPG